MLSDVIERRYQLHDVPRVLRALACCVLFVTSCRHTDESSVTERVWVSSLPRSPRVPFRSFATTRAAGDRYYGVVVGGSLYRGGYDVMSWRPAGADGATIRYLQDRRSHSLEFERCTPSRGFHACIEIRGEPGIEGRYQSRRRWVFRSESEEADTPDRAQARLLAELARVGQDAW